MAIPNKAMYFRGGFRGSSQVSEPEVQETLEGDARSSSSEKKEEVKHENLVRIPGKTFESLYESKQE